MMIHAPQYQALTRGAGVFDFRSRTLIEMSGADAASFLHSFCTQDIKRLISGQGCEAFVTSVQGKLLGHVIVCRQEDRIVLSSMPGQAEKLISHLDRYLIREQVLVTDRSSTWGELLLGGADCPNCLATLLDIKPPENAWNNMDVTWRGRAYVVQRADALLAGPAFLLRGAKGDVEALAASLIQAGGVPCEESTFHAVRIEAGWPLYGLDMTEQNLPQELDRDAAAISFTKGCYLGQETVARIDALGHVNRKMRGLRFADGDEPTSGMALLAGDKEAGVVTSVTFSPKLNGLLALGYVRRGHEAFGTRLTTVQGEAEVVRLPA